MTVEAAGDSAVVLMLRPQTGLGQGVKTSQLSIEPQVHSRESNSAFLDLNSSSERIPF